MNTIKVECDGRGRSSSNSIIDFHQEDNNDIQNNEILYSNFNDNDDAAKNKRLCGAAKKRMRWCLQHGYPYKIAREMAYQPINLRHPSATGDNNTNKTPQITIFIVPESYPNAKFNAQQSVAIESAILKCVDQISMDGPKVKFLSLSFEEIYGYVKIICANEYSKEWLLDEIKLLIPWHGNPKIIGLAQENNLYYVSIRTENDNTNEIKKLTSNILFNRLSKQNDGLDTAQWKCLHFETIDNDTKFTLSIDDHSKMYLKRMNNQLYFNFGKIIFQSFINQTMNVKKVNRREFQNKAGSCNNRNNAAYRNGVNKQRNDNMTNVEHIDQLIMENLKKLLATNSDDNEDDDRDSSSFKYSSRQRQRQNRQLSRSNKYLTNHDRNDRNYDDSNNRDNNSFRPNKNFKRSGKPYQEYDRNSREIIRKHSSGHFTDKRSRPYNVPRKDRDNFSYQRNSNENNRNDFSSSKGRRYRRNNECNYDIDQISNWSTRS